MFLFDISTMLAVVGMFFMAWVLERVPWFRRVPAQLKPVVVGTLAIVAALAVVAYQAYHGASDATVVALLWVAILSCISCTTGYTMLVVPFSDKTSRELLAGAGSSASADTQKQAVPIQDQGGGT